MHKLLVIVYVCYSLVAVAQEHDFEALPRTRTVASPGLDKTKNWRRHFVARDKLNNIYFEVTDIHTISDVRQENVVVVWDRGIGRGVRFRRVAEFAEKLTSAAVEEMAGGSFFRLELALPFAGKTFPEIHEELQRNPKLFEVTDAPITLVTNTVRLTVFESRWRDAYTARAWRTELRSSLSPAFVESLERLRGGMLRAPTLAGFEATLLRFLYYGDDVGAMVAAVQLLPAPPDCRFDADMGHPCTDAQQKSVAEAAKNGQALAAY